MDTFKSGCGEPIFYIGLLVAAPVGEEIFFRGFLLEGFRHSRLGPIGAVLLVSLLWAAVHIQYDLIHMSYVFAAGLLLGAARLRTGSLGAVIGMHSAVNGLAIVSMFLLDT